MIRDLVIYFLRQEEYNGPGDIAVLCAYLGQLQKVRQALKDLKIAVAVDERDEEQLTLQGMGDEVSFEQVVVTKQVRLCFRKVCIVTLAHAMLMS
jgi:ATP-dependent exoDNAse (exonuclease V) beta subunit